MSTLAEVFTRVAAMVPAIMDTESDHKLCRVTHNGKSDWCRVNPSGDLPIIMESNPESLIIAACVRWLLKQPSKLEDGYNLDVCLNHGKDHHAGTSTADVRVGDSIPSRDDHEGEWSSVWPIRTQHADSLPIALLLSVEAVHERKA